MNRFFTDKQGNPLLLTGGVIGAITAILVAAYALVSNMMTQTMGKTLPATILAAARQGLFFIPAVLLMPLWLDQLGVQLAQSVADVLSFLLTLVMMRRVFQNLQAEEHAAMLLQHHRASEPYMAENVPENPETT